jgi:hypothetical protein
MFVQAKGLDTGMRRMTGLSRPEGERHGGLV